MAKQEKRQEVKKACEFILSAILNLAIIYYILKMPRCVWCEEHPNTFTAIGFFVLWIPMLYFIMRHDKTNRSNQR